MHHINIPEVSEDLAEETGLHIGDGSMNFYNNRGLYQLRGHINDDREHYDSHIKKLYEKLYGINVSLREMPSTRVYGFQIWSDELVNFKRKILSLPLGFKKDVSIPNIFLKEEGTIKSVIRGIFDTDGCLYLEPKNHKLYPRMEITTISKPLILQLKEYLKKLGFAVGCWGHFQRNNRAYRVSTRGDKMLTKWFEDIKPANPKFIKRRDYYLAHSNFSCTKSL